VNDIHKNPFTDAFLPLLYYTGFKYLLSDKVVIFDNRLSFFIPYPAMLPELSVVPFSIKKVHNGFSKLEGIARASETGLLLEYEVKILGLVKMQVRELNLPLSEIESIQLKKNWFTTRLIIHTKSLRTLCTVPGSKHAQVILRIPRSNRKKAERLVSMLGFYLSDHTLKAILKQSEDVCGLPK
jgi:hypothetical protein